jgi:hypothetical protein
VRGGLGGGCGKRFITDLADFGHRLPGQRQRCAPASGVESAARCGKVKIGRSARSAKISNDTPGLMEKQRTMPLSEQSVPEIR